MSGAWVAAGVAAATIASSVYTSNKQARAQKAAANQQAKAAAEANKQQQMEFKKANQNEVDISGILDQNSASNTATMLTGPSGAGRNNMLLGGGSSLLGG